MDPSRWKWLVAVLVGVLAGCAGPELAARESPSVASWRSTGRVPSDTFLTRGVGGAVVTGSAGAAPAAEGAGDRDVIQWILLLRKPADVVRWWESGPGVQPERWTHPLSEWERKYMEAMSAATVPEPVRMWPPVTPEHLTAKQRQEAESLFGRGPLVAQFYANRENRRRIVNHYVDTHPVTIGIELGDYRLTRDIMGVSFALERGWQVATGKEAFTKEDVSRLGAAAEFFTALAAGVATGKLMAATRPAPPEGFRPPSEPPPGLQREAHLPDAAGNVVLLERARGARSAVPGAQPSPAMEEPPLASTGTDGAPPGRRGVGNGGPTVTREGNRGASPSRPSAAQEESEDAASAAADDAVEETGQLHHVISRRIAKELEKYPNLKGRYTARDPRFVTRAADKAAHNGYQQWHRDVDEEVITWLKRNRYATQEQFEALLREIYDRPAMRARFPDGF